ncbi:MAG: ThuA domain-containing protein [Verrucomicrobiaceae bacterium]|nr:ThuA domain-containing protein [Verrucomicrobiaceae bacterium]
MKRLAIAAALLLSTFIPHLSSQAAEPLRIFIRSGPKSHAPGCHDHPAFLRDWVPMLNARGAKCTGGDEFPTKEQLAQTDVLIIHRDGGGNLTAEQKELLNDYTKRGGGIVVIHAGCVADKPEGSDYYKKLIGGSWRRPDTKWLEAPMHLYFTDRENPVTKDMSNFMMEDEIYYDMDVDPAVRVLAGAYTPKPKDTGGKGNKEAQARAAEAVAKKKGVNIYDIQPQIWMWEPGAYRAFVCIPGHVYENFNRSNFRAMLLRGIAWAGKRENADELCKPEELGDALRYVDGGPTRPEKAAEKLEVHPEFNISLVASEPLINKPMNIDWDEKGRLWVVETPEYPNGRRELNVEAWKDSGSWTKKLDRDPIDRISWLEDTNGDGVMDKKHVFADKLELATSFVFYKNGVIVCSAPDIWNLQDTDGDGVCDKREKLYTGLGIRDTHAVINNMRWGMDGWIYATHGYSSGEVTSPDGSKKFGTDGSGVVRFKPDGSAFEQYSSRGGNTWGLDITWDGQVFFTQPTSGTVFFHVVLPEYVLAKGKIPGTTSWKGMMEHQKSYPLMSWPEQAYVQIDLVGEFTAAAGCAIYEGGAWPAKWNYSYFTTEPTLNIVHHEFVEKDGVTYKSHKEAGREETEFIRSKDLWFRPIETRVGPDGALYVIDFYNQAVIHNDTRGPIHGPANAAVRPDRDHYFGRIWKVNHKEAKKLEVAKLDKTNPAALKEAAQSNANGPTRELALRLLNEATNTTGKAAAGLSIEGNMPDVGSTALRAFQSSMERGGLNDSIFIPHLIDEFVAARDDWTRSAFIAGAEQHASRFIDACLKHDAPARLEGFVQTLIPSVKESGVEHLISVCTTAPAKADPLKIIILQGIARELNDIPALTPELTAALKKLLAQPALAPAALPLAVKWDKGGALADVIKTQIASLSTTLGKKDAPLPDRIGAAKALIQLGGEAGKVGVQALADPSTPDELSREIIAVLDSTGNAAPLVASLSRLKPALQQTAFDAVLKRPEATQALLTSIADGKVDPKLLGPGNLARLRTHPNKAVAKRAAAMMDKLNPNAKKRAELIAQFTPIVEQPGDTVKGKALFTAACAVCHKLGDIGKDVAPPLTGMGAHGPAELIIHVLDPNREVDPSFYSWNITKNNGETLAGVIASENSAGVTLRNQAGDFEVKKSDIKERVNTKMSLMPEGLEGLGAENIRDILAFIVGDAAKHFRVIPLTDAFTADSRDGLFASADPKGGQVKLVKFGNVTVEGIPFAVVDSAKSSTGANLIVLKGGPGPDVHGQSFPAKVEVALNVETKRLQLLSGISGWGWPYGQDKATAMLATVVYASGEREVFDLKNGIEFADYIRPVEVPGSKFVEDLCNGGQVRLVTLKLTKKGIAKSLILESPKDNRTTPVVVAVTADIEGRVEAKGEPAAAPAPGQAKGKGKGKGKGKAEAAQNGPAAPDSPKQGAGGDGPLAPTTPANWEAGKTKVLVIGGGSSHNFAKFFGDTDVATLKGAGYTVHYTEDRDQAADLLAEADVAVISVNRKFFDTARYRKALMDRVNAGKGVIMLHPGTWYGFAAWPELNAQVVGGGARGHDKLGDFKVNVTRRDHAIMVGVPDSFAVTDELYYVNAEGVPEGTNKIEVLAETTPSIKYNKPHPSVWITDHPKARIVGIALGHDDRVHDLAPFKAILTNSVKWVVGK